MVAKRDSLKKLSKFVRYASLKAGVFRGPEGLNAIPHIIDSSWNVALPGRIDIQANRRMVK
jgi:hypothetical protein